MSHMNTLEDVQVLIAAAAAHGDAAAAAEVFDRSDDDGYVPRAAEIGDLVDMLTKFWAIMTPEQRARAYAESLSIVGEWISK